MANISYGKMSLESRGQPAEMQGTKTRMNLGWLLLQMFFSLILKSAGRPLHFLCPIVYFRGSWNRVAYLNQVCITLTCAELALLHAEPERPFPFPSVTFQLQTASGPVFFSGQECFDTFNLPFIQEP